MSGIKVEKERPDKFTPAYIRKLVQGGSVTKKGLAGALGINPLTLKRLFKDHPELKEAYEQGRDSVLCVAQNSLFKAVKKGNVVATIFMLKNLDPDHYTEQSKVQTDVKMKGAVRIVFKNDLKD